MRASRAWGVDGRDETSLTLRSVRERDSAPAVHRTGNSRSSSYWVT
jgi:hypothetical protein